MGYTDSITSLANEVALVVTRRVESARLLGRDQAPVTSSFTIRASAQPANGKDLERLPEGRNIKDLRVFFSKTELISAGGGSLGDLVAYDGGTFEIEHVEHWSAFGEQYWRAIGRAA